MSVSIVQLREDRAVVLELCRVGGQRARPACEQPPYRLIADRAPEVQRGPWAPSDRRGLPRRLRELPSRRDPTLAPPLVVGEDRSVWQRSGRPSMSPPRAAPRGPVHPSARVLALQRSAGNRAVGVLARMPLKDRTADLATYRQNWDHVEIVKLLRDLDTDEERREALRTLDLTRLDALLDTVRKIQGRSKPPFPAWWTTVAKLVETARTERLETDFADALRQGQVIDTVMLLSWWEDPKALLAKARTIPAAAAANYRDVAGRVLGADHLVTRVLAFLELESLTGAAIRPTAQLAVAEREAGRRRRRRIGRQGDDVQRHPADHRTRQELQL